MYYLVSSRGRITIPKQIREKLRIKAGQQVEVEGDKHSILITLKN
ncbi:MAG: AbrB/MazE/SpoVT family DNA-binding domain-containing protein [Candidatus Aenigmarchaeota archaeon]|nr:AbrB/MazE/SpoVT family DNA-binding domain-containing protein [Candidatus Aenigmarchaeota archaeon]